MLRERQDQLKLMDRDIMPLISHTPIDQNQKNSFSTETFTLHILSTLQIAAYLFTLAHVQHSTQSPWA